MNRTYVCVFVALVVLVITKPILPIWSGIALLAFTMLRANRDLTSPSAKKRYITFKRLFTISTIGVCLIVAGLRIGHAPWNINITTPAAAKHALFALSVYSTAVLVAPTILWAYMATCCRTNRPIATTRPHNSLTKLAERSKRKSVRIAV